jgi:hypothetical protein
MGITLEHVIEQFALTEDIALIRSGQALGDPSRSQPIHVGSHAPTLALKSRMSGAQRGWKHRKDFRTDQESP